MSTPAASVVICTYNRLRMLEQAVESCLRDATTAGLPFEVVVSDNSPSGHAHGLVAGLAAAGHPVRWVAASPPNISVARNTGLAAAAAPLVAFMDDDLVLEPGWLDHLVHTLETAGADVALGPVRPRFEGGHAPGWDPEGLRFTRVLPLPSGTEVRAGGAGKGYGGFVVSTASSIWRAATCFTDALPFDPAYGVSGGEDLDLFLRLQARGRRVVWCAEAGVWETIPAGRLTLRYQLMREFAGAQVYGAVSARHASKPRLRLAHIMARGAAQTVLSTLRLAAALPDRRRDGGQGAFRHLMGTTAGLGKLLWWRKLGLYHAETPTPR